MNILLFDTHARQKLAPISLTRSVADIRMGILTGKERWELMTGLKVYVLTNEYLQTLYEPVPADEYIFIDATFVNFNAIHTLLSDCRTSEDLIDELVSIFGVTQFNSSIDKTLLHEKVKFDAKDYVENCKQVIDRNGEMLRFDFALLTNNQSSQPLPATVSTICSDQIFVEEGATVNHSILNASTGPIYIGKNSVIMEGSLIRGPFAVGESGVVKMGSKIYGATTIGRHCTVGGEIKNSILIANSNKAHDGYLGDSLIGEWCNMGAGTSNSNVKNTGGEINLWNEAENEYISAGNKCGVLMGDFSRTAINSSINTGSFIGVCCNVFGEGLLPKKINNFSWGTKDEMYEIEKAYKDISNWMGFKQQVLSVEMMGVLQYLYKPNQ